VVRYRNVGADSSEDGGDKMTHDMITLLVLCSVVGFLFGYIVLGPLIGWILGVFR
jgi:hypothetical protein